MPQRVTYSDRIQNFATEKSKAIIGKAKENPTYLLQHLGFGNDSLLDLNTIDGLRMTLSNGNIIHLRPSGNAPELRCYAEADDHQTAHSIVQKSLKNIKTFSEI